MDNFDKKTTSTGRTPKDGSEPLTIIEFSLMPEVRQSLEAALRPYVQGQITDISKLGGIIARHFPDEVLKELKAFSKDKHFSSRVYVLRGLPEISPKDIPRKYRTSAAEKTKFYQFLSSKIYSYYITLGLYQALKLELPRALFPELHEPKSISVARYGSDCGKVDGWWIHKHPADLNVLNGVVTDGTPTRFIDWRTLLDEAKQAQYDIPLGVYDPFCREREPKDKNTTLRQFENKYHDWKGRNSLRIISDSTGYLPEHSREVVIGPGDMALWANDGNIFHQALDSRKMENKPGLIRAITGWNFDRPQPPVR